MVSHDFSMEVTQHSGEWPRLMLKMCDWLMLRTPSEDYVVHLTPHRQTSSFLWLLIANFGYDQASTYFEPQLGLFLRFSLTVF